MFFCTWRKVSPFAFCLIDRGLRIGSVISGSFKDLPVSFFITLNTGSRISEAGSVVLSVDFVDFGTEVLFWINVELEKALPVSESVFSNEFESSLSEMSTKDQGLEAA